MKPVSVAARRIDGARTPGVAKRVAATEAPALTQAVGQIIAATSRYGAGRHAVPFTA